ncbi:hypothetical protein BDV26DRAFT_17385 [Aspergillus bertholletiae]|uniref:Uncharacterized protein n=1 Tax=Aspergillus bertholletiae TaxID=1226010 RepID=A0A5N7B1Y0_9EURO|nr:hypothetical protein BDV26DRAFT_17385 [Aspergillus bertholletiae]
MSYTRSLAAAVIRRTAFSGANHKRELRNTDGWRLVLTILLCWSMINTGLALVASYLPNSRLRAALSSTVSVEQSGTSTRQSIE